jgi:nucleotide-binding universal stress UspA family protein
MFKHILLATDGSDSAQHAAKKAMDLARIHGAQVTATFVVDPYPYIGIGSANPVGFQSYMAAAQESAARTFTHLSDMAQTAGVRLEVRLVEDAHVVDGILAMAEQAAADLIVIGSHGRGGLQRLLVGSVATKVVSESTRPVLVVR